MSVVFDQTVGKMQSVAAGLRKNLAEASRFGVSEDKISAMEANGQKALELMSEVEAMRRQVSEKLAEANAQLDKAKAEYASLRQYIRCNVAPDRWHLFGLMDKR